MPLRLALLRFTPLRFVPLRFAFLRSAPLRFTRLRLAALRLAPLRFACLRSAPLRSVPLRIASLRFAPIRRAPMKRAPLRLGCISTCFSLQIFQAVEPFLRRLTCCEFAIRFTSCSIAVIIGPQEMSEQAISRFVSKRDLCILSSNVSSITYCGGNSPVQAEALPLTHPFCRFCAWCISCGNAPCAKTAKNLSGRRRRPGSRTILLS